MTKLRVEAQADLAGKPTFDVSYKETTPLDMDELVQAIGEELFPGISPAENLWPEKIEQKVKAWFMNDLYPDLKPYEKQAPNPNGDLGIDALGVYMVDQEAHSAITDTVEEFLYRLSGTEYDYTDFRGRDWPSR
jgi:hypothetical protein